MDLPVDVRFLAVELARSRLSDLVVCNVELRVIKVNTMFFLQLALHFGLLLVDLLGESVFNDIYRDLFHAIDVDVDSVSASDSVGHFLDALTVHLVHMRLQGARRREFPGAEFASEMTILLVLQKDVCIFKFLLTVVAEWLEHIDSSFLPSHFLQSNQIKLFIFYYYNCKPLLLLIKRWAFWTL